MEAIRRAAVSMLKYPLVFRVLVYSVALFFAVLVYAKLLWSWVRNPSRKFWGTKRRDTPPACLTDRNRGSHGFAQLTDIKLHFVEKGDKTKPLMLFVHGFPEFWYSWRHQMDEFSKDYWVVAFDMRGYGDSDKPEGIHNYDMKYLVLDIKELVEFLGRDKFTLVAHDWGGAVAWFFVNAYPQMLDRYVIMCSAEGSVFAKHISNEKKQFLNSWYMFFFQLPWLPEIALRCKDMQSFGIGLRGGKPKETSAVTDEDIEAYKYTFGKPGALTAPINYYRVNIFQPEKFADMKSSSKEKVDIGVPGLYLAGEKDRYLDVKLLELTKKKYNNLTTKVAGGGSHFVQQDVPKTVNKIMSDFLRDK